MLTITYGPKEKSVLHSHSEGVVVLLADINGPFKMPDGSTRDMQVEVKAGAVNWTDAETHEPENLGNKPFE